jgi:hypothetical protein
MGKPVISTAYSGNMEFTDAKNSILVDYEMKEIEEDVGPYLAGNFWAEPNIDDAAEKMRWVFSNKERAKGLGSVARESIRKKYSVEGMVNKLKQRLDLIKNLKKGEVRNIKNALYVENFELIDELNKNEIKGLITEIEEKEKHEQKLINIINNKDQHEQHLIKSIEEKENEEKRLIGIMNHQDKQEQKLVSIIKEKDELQRQLQEKINILLKEIEELKNKG